MSMTTLNTVRTFRSTSEGRTYRQDKTRTLEARTESRSRPQGDDRKQVRRDKYGR